MALQGSKDTDGIAVTGRVATGVYLSDARSPTIRCDHTAPVLTAPSAVPLA